MTTTWGEKSNQRCCSYWIHFVCLPVIFRTSSSLPLPPSFTPEALTCCAAGSVSTNWGQCRIELCSYGLIYVSISVDREGNRIFTPANPSWVLCTANIEWAVRFKPFHFLSGALLRDVVSSVTDKRISGFWQFIGRFRNFQYTQHLLLIYLFCVSSPFFSFFLSTSLPLL